VARKTRKAGTAKYDENVKTALEIAHLLHLSELELAQLCKSGVLHRSTQRRAGRLHYVFDRDATVGDYIEHLREPARKARDEFVVEKRDTQRVVRAQKELELLIAQGVVVQRARVVYVMTSILSVVKNHVLAIPSRCARLLVGQTDPAKVRAVLKKFCELSVREAKIESDSFDEPHKNGQHSDSGNAIERRVRKRRSDRRSRS
jgi:phage terminase Nu1 subunit (DNA packaging protein)